MGNWDRFDEADNMPFFTDEEHARVRKNFNALQDKYDPIGAALRKGGRFNFGPREDARDASKKLRDAEDVAGWPHSNAYG